MNIFVKALRESSSISEDLAIMKSLFRSGSLNDLSAVAIHIAALSRDAQKVREALHTLSLIEHADASSKAGVLFAAYAHAYHGAIGNDNVDARHGLRDDVVDSHHVSLFYITHGL